MNKVVGERVPQISSELLMKSNKILFVAHLALGDYTYMEACFRAFRAAFPHIRIDIWVDELRRTNDFRKWPSLKKYVLFDWLEASPYFHKIYRETYSTYSLLRSVSEAKRQNYPVVVSFGLSRRTFYARLVKKLASSAFTAAIVKRYKPYDLIKRWVFGRIDVHLNERPPGTEHVSEIYAAWFHQLFGLNLSPQQLNPRVSIPQEWVDDASLRLKHWGVGNKEKRSKRLVFVNASSKQAERSWSVDRALDLMQAMLDLPSWSGSQFVVNTVPEHWSETEAILCRRKLAGDIFLFSATENFFQLPAMLHQCDLIISVETAVMHLANAVGVPVIALMRQLTPEWAPIDRRNSRVVTTSERDDWVHEIEIEQVIGNLPDPLKMQWEAAS